jgi:hypothetical protein
MVSFFFAVVLMGEGCLVLILAVISEAHID